ncbi:MAG: pyridoxamine 5'-phosphate oxidase family protein [Candidatus Eremiobacterota bacterium]
MIRALPPAEAERILDERPGWMVLTTVDPEGYPHSVPMGYVRLDGRFYLGCRADTRKVRNLRACSRVSLYLDNGRTRPHRVVTIQGEGRVIDDPSELEGLRKALGREGAVPGRFAYIEVRPLRTLCWEHA